MLSVIGRLLSAVLLRFKLGSTGCYLAATCHTNPDRVLNDLRQLRTLHELILNAVGQGIYGLDGDGEVTPGNATTLDTLRKLSSQKQCFIPWKVFLVWGHRPDDR
jgi:hypothetical protein